MHRRLSGAAYHGQGIVKYYEHLVESGKSFGIGNELPLLFNNSYNRKLSNYINKVVLLTKKIVPDSLTIYANSFFNTLPFSKPIINTDIIFSMGKV